MRNAEAKHMFRDTAIQHFGEIDQINRAMIKELLKTYDLKWPSWITGEAKFRAGRGLFFFPDENLEPMGTSNFTPKTRNTNTRSNARKIKPAPAVQPMQNVTSENKVDAVSIQEAIQECHIPTVDKNFVNWGHCKDLSQIIKTSIFYPVFITGLSGNGKTMMVDQLCAKQNRELFRVNVTIETDEDDLLGGFRLKDGETVWHNGPVIQAMERGAVLLLDEIDLASNKIMCLQPVLEGKGVFIKKIGKFVKPAPGFNVIATANTKGKGSDDGRFIGTNILNEAFLERFPVTLEQPYPSDKVEAKILTKVLSDNLIQMTEMEKDFVKKLTDWASSIRKSFIEGAINDIITTRRLVHICTAYSIFNCNRMKAIEMNISRFDDDTKLSFLDFYTKIDANTNMSADDESTTNGSSNVNVPF